MAFSRTSPPSAVACCPNPCIDAKARDQVLRHRARETVARTLARRQTGSVCDNAARQVPAIAARMDRYEEALPYARAARDMNERGDQRRPGDPDKPLNQNCITRLPSDAAGLNRALGIDPRSRNAITERDLRDDSIGHRAALYRDDTNGQVILVARDTQPNTLVDWKTNIDNGQGRDTDQYQAMRNLSGRLVENDVNFNVAGYSKGGGLAQEAGLMSPNSQVFVFNSAGLHEASLARTGTRDFGSLTSRTHAFSAEGDFLTYMNNTTNPSQQVTNARFLRNQVAGTAGSPFRGGYAPSAGIIGPMQLDHLSPADLAKDSPAFRQARGALLADLDDMIARRAVGFPPVRAASKDTIPNSMSAAGRLLGAGNGNPNLGKLAQHQMSNVVGTAGHPGAMENQIAADRAFLNRFQNTCG